MQLAAMPRLTTAAFLSGDASTAEQAADAEPAPGSDGSAAAAGAGGGADRDADFMQAAEAAIADALAAEEATPSAPPDGGFVEGLGVGV